MNVEELCTVKCNLTIWITVNRTHRIVIETDSNDIARSAHHWRANEQKKKLTVQVNAKDKFLVQMSTASCGMI